MNRTADLTAREVMDIEGILGTSASHWEDDGVSQGRLLAAMAYVFTRRTDPDVTLDQMLDTPLSQLSEVLGMGEDDED